MKALIFYFRRVFRIVVCVILLHFYYTSQSQTAHNYKRYCIYLTKAKDNTVPELERKAYLQEAYQEISAMPIDSLKYSSLSSLAVVADHLNDTLRFQKIASQSLKVAKKLNSLGFLADAHWNYGAYYLNHQKYDSSYYHYDRAYKQFTAINNNYYGGKMLYNMAYVSSLVNDYTGAEIHLFEAIRNFEMEQKSKQLYLCYNLLGTISDDMEEFSKAMFYYKKASSYIPQIEKPHFEQVEYWNNMGLIHHRMGNYPAGITSYKNGLAVKDVKTRRPSLYAKLLDNLAFSEFMIQPQTHQLVAMETALAIRDSIGDTPGSIISSIHISKFFAKQGDTINAIKYASNAYASASKSHLNRDILKSLDLLASLDLDKRLFYYQKHIALSKALTIKERNIRNKFTAIRFETKHYILRNEKLSEERTYIIVGAFSLMLIILLLYGNSRQRARYKELLFEREQQQYNEDMYLLALQNKTVMERGRNQERLRISQDLHDGVLARLFSVRFKWPYLELSGNPNDLLQHNNSIGELIAIEKEIRNISHDLRNDLIWDEIEFINEIKNTLQEKSELGNFEYIFHCNEELEWEQLDYLDKINIGRIVDEILQNIIKHAMATEVAVEFAYKANTYFISIKDNGKGFNPQYKQCGMRNLKSIS